MKYDVEILIHNILYCLVLFQEHAVLGKKTIWYDFRMLYLSVIKLIVWFDFTISKCMPIIIPGSFALREWAAWPYFSPL